MLGFTALVHAPGGGGGEEGETLASLRVTASWRPCLSPTKWTGFLLPPLTLMTIFYEEVFLVLKVQVGIQVESISSHGEQRV